MFFSLVCFAQNYSQLLDSPRAPVFVLLPRKAIRNAAQPLRNLPLVHQMLKRDTAPNAGLIFLSFSLF